MARIALSISLVLAALLTFVGVGLGVKMAAGGGPAAVDRARRVASQFFTALSERRYDRACALFSADFYRLNRVPDRRHCVLGLTVGLGTGSVTFRITNVGVDHRRATVDALANGVPGRLVLVEEGSRYRVLALEGA